MRNFLGMSLKRIEIHPCSTSGCKALTSNIYCKKCIDRQEVTRQKELATNTLNYGLVSAELIDRQTYGIGPIQPSDYPIGILSEQKLSDGIISEPKTKVLNLQNIEENAGTNHQSRTKPA